MYKERYKDMTMDIHNLSLSVEEAISLFRMELLEKGKSERTIEGYCRHDLKKMLMWLRNRWNESESTGEVTVQNITRTDIRDLVTYWKTSTPLAGTTINRQIAAVKTFFAFLHEKKIILVDPASEITVKRIQRQNKIRWLSRQQIGRLFHVVETQTHSGEFKKKRDKALISVLVNTGVRITPSIREIQETIQRIEFLG